MPTTINRNSPIPLYFQLKQILLEKIRQNEWKPGEMIPGEHDFEDTYGISRTVVRQTLAELVNEGYLVRQRGRGTFIAQPKVAYDPSRRFDLNEFMEQQGVKLSWALIDSGFVETSNTVRDTLSLTGAREVFRLRRLRLAGDDPIGYHVAYVPAAVAAGIDHSMLCEGESLTYLAKYPPMKEPRLERTLEASLAENADLEFLPIKKNSPVLHLERRVLDAQGVPIEYLVARFRGDRFKFRVTS
jgi:GntR family transcriptional regulator